MQEFVNPLLALHDVTIGLLSQDNPDILLDTILDQAIEFTEADSGSIALLDENRTHLEIKVFRGLSQDIPEKVKLKLGEGVTGRCILTGKLKNVGNTKADPSYISVRSDIQSELAVPLKAGSKSFGVISLDSSRTEAFKAEHEEYLLLLSSYAAQIYTKQETIRHLNHRSHIQDTLIEIVSFIGKDPSFSIVFQEIILHLEKKVQLKRAAIFILEDVSSELVILNSLNYTDEEIEKSHYKPGEGITGNVFTTKQPIAIIDIGKDKTFLNKSGIANPDSQMSFFCSPIIVNDETKGVFSMQIPYSSHGKYGDYLFLVQILSTFFSQAISIHNLIDQSKTKVHQENLLLKRQFDSNFTFENIIGRSNVMQDLFQVLQMGADSNSTILLKGESGTGKELFATAIHRNSLRKTKRLVKINCAAIPSDLLESELFGYNKGAFTGADKDHQGKFLIAHQGTLFLDEIGEMDYRLQSKLLRFLQEKEFSPLGSNKVYKVDVRIISATNANLEELIKAKLFREDLFYRLNVIGMTIPPLRDRKQDIPMITNHLLKQIAKRNNKVEKSTTEGVFKKLESYNFPGNVRELENILERAFVLSQNKTIKEDDIILPEVDSIKESTVEPKEVITLKPENGNFSLNEWINVNLNDITEGDYYKNIIGKVEKELIIHVLKSTFYNKSKSARILGVNRLTLDKKIKELKIQ